MFGLDTPTNSPLKKMQDDSARRAFLSEENDYEPLRSSRRIYIYIHIYYICIIYIRIYVYMCVYIYIYMF